MKNRVREKEVRFRQFDLLDVPAENRNGTVYAPVRALCEALGFDVEWKDGEVMIA